MSDAHILEPETARSIVIERTLGAPRELVFEVFTDAKHLSQWWGPDGFSLTTERFEFRVGGAWRFVMHGPDGRDYQNHQIFEAIEPPARILMRQGGAAEGVGASHETRILLEADGARTQLTWTLVFSSIAERDRVARDHGAEEGGRQNAARLAAYVEARAK